MKKIPVDYLAHSETDSKLKAHLRLKSERELLDFLGCDFFYLPGRDISQNEGAVPFYKGRLDFYPGIQKLCALAHSYNLKVMMHSCGAIEPLIPHLIAAGVDILDPVQVTAKGMIPSVLAQKYGSKITFHGGIDTQNILPFGNAETVRRHVLETVEAMAPAGRYIFAPSQILGSDIPLENILTMYEAIGEINAVLPRRESENASYA
jgi:hypothetical protein